MSSSFEDNLQMVCNALQIARQSVKSYTEHAQEIQNYIIEKMKRINAAFKKAFRGLSSTGNYWDGIEMEKPYEFDIHIKLGMDSKIIADLLSGPNYELCVPESIDHKLVVNGSINCDYLQSWIGGILNIIIPLPIWIKCGSEQLNFKLEYLKNENSYDTVYTILATSGRISMYFDFVPVFQFEQGKLPIEERNKFLVPHGKILKGFTYIRTFMIYASHWEHELLKDKTNLQKSIRLLKALRDANEMSHLSNKMLRSIYVMELKQGNEQFWNKSPGEILIDMIERTLKYFGEMSLPFYWDRELNHLDELSDGELTKYQRQLHSILNKLKSFRQGTIKYEDLTPIFVVC